MDKLISVVLPVYNGERFLRESIDSVIRQTYTNWELLILDDCSTDTTPDIAKEYQQKDPRVKYYRNETNLKLPGNLNKGFSLAKGEYLTWTSDDNYFDPTAFEKMLKVLQEKRVQLVYASYQVIDENGNDIQLMKAVPLPKERILGSNLVGACFMYTREVYETVGDYDTSLFLVEDWDYWQRVFMKFDVAVIEETLYWYRHHGGTLTSTKNNKIFGEVSEKMLLQNRKGFGKLDFVTTCDYYAALCRSRENQGGKNPYAMQHRLYHTLYRIKRKIGL